MTDEFTKATQKLIQKEIASFMTQCAVLIASGDIVIHRDSYQAWLKGIFGPEQKKPDV